MSDKEKEILAKHGKLKPIVRRKYVTLMSDFFILSYADISNYEEYYSVPHFVRMGYLTHAYWYGDEYKQLGDKMMAEEEKNPGLIMNAFSKLYSLGEEVMSLSEEIKNNDYSNKSHEELLKVFNKFAKLYQDFSIALGSHSIQHPVEEKLKKLLQDRENPDEDLSILSYPLKDNFSVLEQKNLLRIAILLKKKGVESFEDLTDGMLREIRKHIEEYGWINVRGGLDELWSEKEIFARIKSVEGDPQKKLKEAEVEKKDAAKQTESILKKICADKEIRKLVDLAKEVVYFRTYRTDYANKAFVNIKPLLEALSEKMSLSYKGILYLRKEEIQKNITPEKEELERRKDDYAVITTEPYKVIFSSDPERIKELKSIYCEDYKASSNIKGQTAFSGKVKGKARIVMYKSDLDKVKEGDIMVSPMTTPDFITAMERAAGFVTDEGGISCHAAIVAREMKKPCIVGTKSATKSIEDGEMVEVDAKNGVVRKL